MKVDWIRLAHDWVKWKALIRTVMNLRVLQNVGDFVASLRPGRITRWAVLSVLGVTSLNCKTPHSQNHYIRPSPNKQSVSFCSRCTVAPSRHFACLSTAKWQHYELCQGAAASPDPLLHVKYEWLRCSCTSEHPNTWTPASLSPAAQRSYIDRYEDQRLGHSMTFETHGGETMLFCYSLT